MTLGETLIEVWRQVLVDGNRQVDVAGSRYRVSSTSRTKLRTVGFEFEAHHLDGIEQNPETASRWAKLAQEGKHIMQFRCAGRYIGNVAEGKLTRYPAWRSLGLPE